MVARTWPVCGTLSSSPSKAELSAVWVAPESVYACAARLAASPVTTVSVRRVVTVRWV